MHSHKKYIVVGLLDCCIKYKVTRRFHTVANSPTKQQERQVSDVNATENEPRIVVGLVELLERHQRSAVIVC